MSKRAAETAEDTQGALKHGDRPIAGDDGEDEQFEDDYEDEFESEDDIMEAGVDGRPDDEREAEERAGAWCFLQFKESLGRKH